MSVVHPFYEYAPFHLKSGNHFPWNWYTMNKSIAQQHRTVVWIEWHSTWDQEHSQHGSVESPLSPYGIDNVSFCGLSKFNWQFITCSMFDARSFELVIWMLKISWNKSTKCNFVSEMKCKNHLNWNIVHLYTVHRANISFSHCRPSQSVHWMSNLSLFLSSSISLCFSTFQLLCCWLWGFFVYFLHYFTSMLFGFNCNRRAIKRKYRSKYKGIWVHVDVLMFMFSCRSFQEATKDEKSLTKRNINEQRTHKTISGF